MLRSTSYLTNQGKGEEGGRTGAIKGKKKTVTSAESHSRSTLVTQQPGQPRSKDGFAPFNQPKLANKPGHLLFAMDIPRVAGKAGKTIDPSSVVRRLTINRNQDKGAQLTIEEYLTGKKAKKGELDKETGHWIKSNAAKGITREVISVETFNISEIQRTRISQTTLSSVAETEIEVRDEIHVHKDPGTKDKSSVDTMAEKGNCFAGCCTKDFEPGLFPVAYATRFFNISACCVLCSACRAAQTLLCMEVVN